MKVTIMVYSKTGNTLKFANAIKEKLKDRRHQVKIVELHIEPHDWQGRPKDGKEFTIVNLPDCRAYDAVLIGSPVWGASATPIIMKAVKEMKGLSGKKVIPFSTQAFPFSFLGGNRTLRMISKEAKKRGAKVQPGRNITYLFHDVEKLMDTRSEEIAIQL